jgi:hypothetical protein
MGLKERMIGILRGSDTQRIKFSFTGSTGIAISVDGGSFRRVAQALEENRIHVQTGGVADGWAKYSARAEGTSAANTFYIGANNTSSRDFDGLIVHEAVHAAFDLTNSTLPWLDNEAAAYIAQGYYLRNSGYSASRMNTLGMPYLGRMIVNEIRSGGDVQGFWMEQLRDSLLSDPQYHSYIRGTFTGDG